MRSHVKLLNRAKELIENGNEAFICLALERAYLEFDNSLLWEAWTELDVLIKEGIGNNIFFHEWMWDQGLSGSFEDAQLGRMAWLDKLSESYT